MVVAGAITRVFFVIVSASMRDLDALLRAHPAAHKEVEHCADVHEQQEGACNGECENGRLRWAAGVVEHGDRFLVNRKSTCSIP